MNKQGHYITFTVACKFHSSHYVFYKTVFVKAVLRLVSKPALHMETCHSLMWKPSTP